MGMKLDFVLRLKSTAKINYMMPRVTEVNFNPLFAINLTKLILVIFFIVLNVPSCRSKYLQNGLKSGA